MRTRLTGRVCLVTGAASGIGRAAAQACAREGAALLLVDLDPRGLETISDEQTATGTAVSTVLGDVAETATWERVAKVVRTRWGRVDVLINNAAVQPVGSLLELSDDALDRVVDVNVKGAVRGCRAILPFMIAQRRGVIPLTSSVLGFTGDPDLAAYGATKGALLALTKSLAVAYVWAFRDSCSRGLSWRRRYAPFARFLGRPT